MSDQTPAEMRLRAGRLRQIAESQRMDFQSPHVAMTLDEAADALDCLADVIEYAAKAQENANVPFGVPPDDYRGGSWDTATGVLRIARGEVPGD